MAGSVRSADAKFKNPASQISAHYGVGLDGRVVQWVAESDTAFHAGNSDMDLSSIGIEHEDDGNYDAPRTDALYSASSSLVREICQRYGIPISRQWIIKHSEVPGAATRCPDALDIDRIVTMAEGAQAPAQPIAESPAPAVATTEPPGPQPATTQQAGQPQPIADALREISANVYGDPSRWQDIYDAIKGVVADAPGLGHLLAAPSDQSIPQPDAAGPAGSPSPAAVVGVQGPPPPTKLWGGSQGAIFSLQIFYLTILAVLAIIYFTDRSLINLPESLGPISVAVPWFGALGAVVISLVGTTEHRQDWDPSYRFWHWSRPLLGASFGSVSVLIFQAGILAVGSTPTANPQSVPRNLLYYLVAFVVGYREETFRELIKRVTDIILSPGPGGAGPAVGSMSPQTGPASGGTAVTVLGSGLKNTDTIRFGAVPAKFRIDGDSQITITSPPGQTGASVTVTVAAKAATAMAGTFTYT